ncbi:pyridoxal phosphate-dependent aminotransferase [Umezawaea sp. Da 62-37]|uniref:pyridoxal phosphate-dependent aminotransferase n=1 Tax=Umezawaea sp. Da 62-37 TaxID=3075927 RepID=UPI0028F7217B|nr:pyridoxal phosphate-dependent aminotransferase [Umezawaea sp. Da 62-37]WNV85804.1 pyridoxal phosphate-dependent aminotransferase [Umezawaea sp. Da 62-37]
MTSARLLDDLLTDSVAPNRLRDVGWLREYLAAGSPAGDPIVLSLGEPWGGVPDGLLAALRDVPGHAHGYQMSMYGLPRLRRSLRDYVARTQGLPSDGRWELAVGWTGTRSAMCDFARHLAGAGHRPGGTVLVLGPSWDYAGVFAPYGYRVEHLDCLGADGFAVDEAAIRAWRPADGGDVAVVVVNAQHNPSGHDLAPGVCRALLELALDASAAILVDDAYFGVSDASPPTSASALLHELLGEADPPAPWLAVRSLGKQFHCNGWALGAVLAEPAFLDEFVNVTRTHHTYNHGVLLQWAMADWLADTGGVEAFLRAEREACRAKREYVVGRLRAAGVPDRRIVTGPAAPYLSFPVPEGDHGHARRCVLEAGVVLSEMWPLARVAERDDSGYLRLFLGPERAVLAEALDRLDGAGLTTSG